MTNDGKWTYTYDYENRLIVAQDSSLTAIYIYDSFGRRIHKDIRDSNEVLVSSTSYFYDGAQVISEYNESDTQLRKYIYGPGIDEPILIENTIGDRYYYHFDGLGSITELTDSAGTIVEKYTYDVYGKTTIRDSEDTIINTSQIDNPYGFTGRRLDPETGLYYYRARYYSPDMGRFLQTDPIGYYDSMNLYQYCLNNPVNFVDPWGLEAGIGGGIFPKPGEEYPYKRKISNWHINRNILSRVPMNEPRRGSDGKDRDGLGNVWHKDLWNPFHKGNSYRGTGKCKGSQAEYVDGKLDRVNSTYDYSPIKYDNGWYDPIGILLHLPFDEYPHFFDQNYFPIPLENIYDDRPGESG